MARGKIGIAGAGLLGRLLAWQLALRDWDITLFDRDDPQGLQSCGYTGGGLLTPISELETADPLICELGLAALSLWPTLLDSLPEPVFFQQQGCLVVAHPTDQSELQRVQQKISHQLSALGLDLSLKTQAMQWLEGTAIQTLEPDLPLRFDKALWLPLEGQLDNKALMGVLQRALLQHPRVNWHARTPVLTCKPHQITTREETFTYDWVLDTRGLGAKEAFNSLRGVRGEIVLLRAPEVNLSRPIRLMHPRFHIYVAPRPQFQFIVGASSIESEDMRPITVQSLLELLSAAFSLHPGFAEATVEWTGVNTRPALPHNNPALITQPGLIQINGLYRNGFLISPVLVQSVLDQLAGNPPLEMVADWMETITP